MVGRGRLTPILINVILLLLLVSLPDSVRADAGLEISLPYALSPYNQWGGAFSGEFEKRDLDSGEEVEVRKIMFRLGWTPLSYGSVWAEAGVASLTLKTDSMTLGGDFGSTVGGGGTIAVPWISLMGYYPFVSGRATMFISRLSDDRQVKVGLTQSRRSKYQWQELSGVFGLGHQTKWGVFYFGAAMRTLDQDEWRTTRSNNNLDKRKFNYKSGLKPGVTLAMTTNLRSRFHIHAEIEVYDSITRVTLSFGQWGMPNL